MNQLLVLIYMQPGWYQPVIQELMENECEALPGVAYPGVRDNRSTINTKTGYDDDDDDQIGFTSNVQ